MQFINSSLEKLVKNLSGDDFKYFTKKFGSKNLEPLKQKGVYSWTVLKDLIKKKLPDKKTVFTAL